MTNTNVRKQGTRYNLAQDNKVTDSVNSSLFETLKPLQVQIDNARNIELNFDIKSDEYRIILISQIELYKAKLHLLKAYDSIAN